MLAAVQHGRTRGGYRERDPEGGREQEGVEVACAVDPSR